MVILLRLIRDDRRGGVGCGGSVPAVRVKDVEEMRNKFVDVEIRGCGNVGGETG